MTHRTHRSLHERTSANPHTVELKVTKLNDHCATLEAEKIGQLKWPTDELPKDIKIGDSVKIQLHSPENPSTFVAPSPNGKKSYDELRQLLEELLA